MRDTYILSGLIKRRAELAGEIIGARKFISTATTQLAVLDQALTMFGYGDPSGIEPIAKVPAYLFCRSELQRLIRDIYRDCPELTSHKEIAVEVIRRKEWDADAALVLSIAYRVRKARRRIRLNEAARQETSRCSSIGQ